MRVARLSWAAGSDGDEMELTAFFSSIIKDNAGMSDREFLQSEFNEFMQSKRRRDILTARDYYKGRHDILRENRQEIGENGRFQDTINATNYHIVNNMFDDLVDQKVSYLLSKPIEVKTDNTDITDIFGKSFMRKMKQIGKDALIGGYGALLPYIDINGDLKFKRMKPEQLLLFWADEEHEVLDAFAYFYNIERYNRVHTKEIVTKIEYYQPDKVSYFIWEMGQLREDTERHDTPYIVDDQNQTYKWDKIPLVVFKANDEELPLILRVKCLQDALNTIMSNFMNNMTEDARNTILVIKNYDGEDLNEFRRKIVQYGAVKIRTVDGVDGGVDALTINVNANNYTTILKTLKDTIIENGRGFDAKDDRMSSNPNQMNINSMYSDIDLDASDMENEFQAAFEQLMFFVNAYLSFIGKATEDDVEFVFNRDLPINEADTITNCRNSVGIISEETIISNHPWTIDTAEELKRLKRERQETMTDYVTGGDVHDEKPTEENS